MTTTEQLLLARSLAVFITKMLNPLERRIVDLSYRHKLTHISSCLNTVNVLAEIYEMRKEDEPVVLGNSHAALALYVVLESNGLCDAEEMIAKHGTHASRDMANGIWVSGGSLGQAETVAVGLALSDRNRIVWLVTSDGACLEGSVAEAFRIASKHCPNLQINIICNGYGAYGEIATCELPRWTMHTTLHKVGGHLPQWMQGLAGHYITLNETQHEELMA